MAMSIDTEVNYIMAMSIDTVKSTYIMAMSIDTVVAYIVAMSIDTVK